MAKRTVGEAGTDVSGLYIQEPHFAKLVNVFVVILAVTVSVALFSRRFSTGKSWRKLPYISWLPLLAYTDLYIFTLGSAILQFSFINMNNNIAACLSSNVLCLCAYFSTKSLMHLFLVDRAHIVRSTPSPRLKSKLYIFNSFGLIGVYVIVSVLLFIFRINKIRDNLCIIGLRRTYLIPLLSVEIVINIYLTLLFLVPLLQLHSVKLRWGPQIVSVGSARIEFSAPPTEAGLRLRNLALRALAGACFTLVITTSNVAAGVVLNGEPGWLCLLTCRSDVLLNVIVLHWLTSKREPAADSAKDKEAQPYLGANNPVAARPTPDFPDFPGLPVSRTASISPTNDGDNKKECAA